MLRRLAPLVCLSALVCACRAEESEQPRPDRAEIEAEADAHEEKPAQVNVELGLVDDAAREALAARLGPESPAASFLAAGGTLLAVHHHIQEGWHIYWENPGESGLRTRLSVEAEGASIGPVLYPGPDRFTADGGQVSYGWGHEAVLFVPLRADPAKPPEDTAITVRSDYLACAQSCIPGHAELSTTLAALATSSSAALAPMLARVPEPAGERVTARWSDGTLRVAPAGLEGSAELELAELFPYALDAALLEGQRATQAGALELDYRFTDTAPADQGQGVLRSTIAGETRYLELAVPWPAT